MANWKSPRRIVKNARVDALTTRGEHELAELEAAIVGTIVLPIDPSYDADRQESNPAFQAYPQIIVYCEVASDVRWALTLAQQKNYWVAARSGGHSTAGYSVNSGIVIDTSRISYVSIDSVNKVARVGPGTDFDTLNGALDGTGFHIPGGACGNVCVAGFMQGGGYGYTSRMFGMNCDNVVAVTILLADLSIVTASETEHADLFWAIRGGTGGNFGIIIEITYALRDLDTVWAWAIQWDIADAPAALLAMQQDYTRGAPPEIGYMTNICTHDKAQYMLVQGMYCGTALAGKAALAPLLKLGSAQLLVDETGTYGKMDTYLDNHPYEVPDLPLSGSMEDKQAGYISKPLALADWQTIVTMYASTPKPYDTVIIEPYGGTIEAYGSEKNAFIHRTADLNLFVDVFWLKDADKGEAVAWLDAYMKLMQPYYDGHIYQNYPRRTIANFREAYWGDAFPRLLAIKQKYDPTNVFHYEQSISPKITD